MAALTSLIQQGAAANVYKTNLIDSPAEVLTFGLSLFGCFAISLLLGVCVGWKLFKGSGGGGGGGRDHSPFGTDNPAASKQEAAYGDVEMPKYNNPLEDASSVSVAFVHCCSLLSIVVHRCPSLSIVVHHFLPVSICVSLCTTTVVPWYVSTDV